MRTLSVFVSFLISSIAARHLRSNEIDLLPFKGKWIQWLSDKYVQTTSEVDYQCIRVNVTSAKVNDTEVVTLHKDGIQHKNSMMHVHWAHSYVPDLTDPTRSSLEDNLVLQPYRSDSNLVTPLYFRRTNAKLDYIIWTGLDNKTMFVWIKEFNDVWNTDVTLSLTELDFETGYKEPTPSFTAGCLL